MNCKLFFFYTFLCVILQVIKGILCQSFPFSSVSCLRNFCLLKVINISLIPSSESFVLFFHLGLYSIWNWLLYMMRGGLTFFPSGYPVDPAPFSERPFFSHCLVLSPLSCMECVNESLVKVCFWSVLFLWPFVHVSLFLHSVLFHWSVSFLELDI